MRATGVFEAAFCCSVFASAHWFDAALAFLSINAIDDIAQTGDEALGREAFGVRAQALRIEAR